MPNGSTYYLKESSRQPSRAMIVRFSPPSFDANPHRLTGMSMIDIRLSFTSRQ
jgi:hypothetical protein